MNALKSIDKTGFNKHISVNSLSYLYNNLETIYKMIFLPKNRWNLMKNKDPAATLSLNFCVKMKIKL